MTRDAASHRIALPGEQMLRGVLAALGAGLMWGLVFLVPLVLWDYPPLLLAVGRYTAFGLLALGLAWLDRDALSRLTRGDWLEALKLSLVGNLCYFSSLAAAIQLAGAPVPTLMIGTLPVVIAISANLLDRRNGTGGGVAWRRRLAASPGGVAWRRLVLPLLLISAGLFSVHHGAGAPTGDAALQGPRYAVGCLLAAVALFCWTWYPIRNSRWMHAHPPGLSRAWATAQGVTVLPLSLLAGLGVFVWQQISPSAEAFAWPFGPRPALFIGWMVAIGLCASWLGTLLWNKASQLLPAALVGQLIVFETLSALLYVFLWYRRWPTWPELLGIVLLIAGVLIGVRVFRPAEERS